MNSSFFLGSVAAAIGFFTLLKKFRFPQDTKSSSLSLPSPSTSLSLPSPSTSLSLPSPSTSVSRTWKHNVFPSFHGADVRRAFLSHILEAFKRKGIDIFIDNNIERSKSIGPALKEAIRGSKIAIVLLSKNYASSSWCLDELVEIMKCREALGQIVMTIFYEVDPTDIKKQTGDFGKAFRKTCKAKTKEHTERWRKALEDVATIAGEHNWNNEAAMIEKIATDVSNILNNSTPSRDFDGLVGMRTHMEEMKELLRLDLDEEVRMIGIWGPPGIGKTTIARVLFNQVSSRFQLGAIMVDIKGCYPRPCLDEYDAQLQLQKQMLSQIINQKDIQISHLGVAQERLKDKKVLLVLDEVDQLGQLDALAKEIQWFGPGSRIIITAEDLRVLNAHRIHHIYKVKFPSSNEAFQIFCTHAFGQKHPDDGFFELAWEVTYLAGKLPLGLKVLGSALKGKSKHEWERTLPRLKTRLDKNIESIIKFSYDALDDEDKYLFLYIACLFTSESTRKVEGVLEKHISSVGQGLRILAQKSLISIDEHGRISMHTLLQKFGRETAKKEFIYHGLAKRQLLVNARDICQVLSDDTTDCKPFIGINFDLSETEEELNISEKALERLHDFQFVKIKGNNLAHPKRLHSLLYHSQKIRSLHWNYFQNIYLPSNFNPEFLVELNMRSSKLEKLWEGTRPLRNLKWMDLSESRDLKELPDLSTATKLEELILQNCSSLVELPSSIGSAINLQKLDLSQCSRLLELPSSIGNAIINLKKLDLSYCSSLRELPSSIGNAIINLQKLNLFYCLSLLQLPSSIGNAINLQELNLSYCRSLVKIPSSIENATNLRKLDLSYCSNLVELPSSVGNANNLQKLNLFCCSSLRELPSSIGNAINLQELNLCYCRSLVELPSSIMNITNLKDLDLEGCSSLVKLPFSLGNATNLQKLNLRDCTSLVKIPSSIESATNLQKLDLSNCSNLVELPSIGNPKLKILNLADCSSLVELSSSINSPNLQKLYLKNCSRVVKLPAMESATNLRELDLEGCSNLVELPSIGNLKLEILNLTDCSSLVELSSSINAPSLQELYLRNCSRVVKLPSIENATNLQKLDLEGCSSLQELPPSIGTFANLWYLDISGWSSLVELHSSIEITTSLQILDLSYCSNLMELPALENATSLRKLYLQNCLSLQELHPSIGTATNLRELDISGCSSLVELPSSIGNLQRLYYLIMRGCSKLEALPTNINLESLEILDLTNCSQLKSFPEISTNISNLKLTGTAIKEVPSSMRSWSRLSNFQTSYFESLKEFPHALDIITELHLVNEDIKEVPPWVKGMSSLCELRLDNCNNLVSLPQLSDSLRYLFVENCQSLERLDCSFNNPEICLKFVKCLKLNQEARDLIMHTSTSKFAMLPGTEVPDYFNHRATGGGSLTIKLNESQSLPTSLRFKACIMLVKDEEESDDDEDESRYDMRIDIDIMDKQKDLEVQCTPSHHYINRLLTEHIYTFEVEAGKVTSTELVFEFETVHRNWKIGECGLLQISKASEMEKVRKLYCS